MSGDKDRLQIAQWILERNLAWVAAAEVKVAVIVTIDMALLGSIGAAYSAATPAARVAHADLFWTISAAIFVATGIVCAAMAVLPRLKGPTESLVFFGYIRSLPESEYLERFKSASESRLLEDWVAQIHRNAQIAHEKFSWVRRSMWLSFLSVIPWAVAIRMLSIG